MGAIEYIARGMKYTLGKALMSGLSLGIAGNILLDRADFAIADDTLETKPYLVLAKQDGGYTETSDDSISKEMGQDFYISESDVGGRKPSPLRRGGRYMWELGKNFTLNILDDTKTVYGKPKNWLYLGLAGGSALALSTQDEKINDYFKKRSWVDHDLANYIEDKTILGLCLFGLDTGFLVYGKIYDDSRALTCGKAMLNALIIDQLTCSGLKRAIRRERPDNGSKHSFPSSHSSGAFAAASVISEMYDNKWYILALTYLAAGAVAMERIDTNSHWASDVLFGAALGEIIGRVVAKNRKKDMEKDTVFLLEPMMDRDSGARGIMLTYRWNGDLLKSLGNDIKKTLK